MRRRLQLTFCYLTQVLSAFLFLMLWLHSLRLATQLCSCSCIWNTHAYLFPVNEAAACHMFALSNKTHLLLFSIYLLEIKTAVYSWRSNHGLRFKIGYSKYKRIWRWKVKLSLCQLCTTSYKGVRNGGEDPPILNPSARRIWLCSFTCHLHNLPDSRLVSYVTGGWVGHTVGLGVRGREKSPASVLLTWSPCCKNLRLFEKLC